jgi:hypothetical protein
VLKELGKAFEGYVIPIVVRTLQEKNNNLLQFNFTKVTIKFLTTHQSQVLIMSIQFNIYLLVDGGLRFLMVVLTAFTGHFLSIVFFRN